jgi:uncharacterized protein YegL
MTTHTHTILIIDRSGSMEPLRNDVIGGLNSFIAEQRDAVLKGKDDYRTITEIRFDHQYELKQNFTPVDKHPGFGDYTTRGQTALVEAVQRAITDEQKHIDLLPDGSKPDRVVVAVYTDGHENASPAEYSKESLKSNIEHFQTQGWNFIWMGADAEAFDEAQSYGIHKANVVQYANTSGGVRRATRGLSQAVSYVSGPMYQQATDSGNLWASAGIDNKIILDSDPDTTMPDIDIMDAPPAPPVLGKDDLAANT